MDIIDDTVNDAGYVQSEGCGHMSMGVALAIRAQHPDARRRMPSGAQVRVAGFKGVLVLKKDLGTSGELRIALVRVPSRAMPQSPPPQRRTLPPAPR